MSQIVQILNFIELWLKQNKPNELEQVEMRSFLMPEQIEQKVAVLPYKLPKEIVELYQWLHSSHRLFLSMPDGDFNCQGFLNLDEAISLSMDWNNSVFPNMNVFPLLSVSDAMYWTVGSDKQQDIAPIYSNDYAEFPSEPDVESLTAFLLQEVERLQGTRKIDE